MNEISLTIIDRENKHHLLKGPTDMNMNIMEICKAYDLPVIGECGGNGNVCNLSMLFRIRNTASTAKRCRIRYSGPSFFFERK